jgi:hypothetical protein
MCTVLQPLDALFCSQAELLEVGSYNFNENESDSIPFNVLTPDLELKRHAL